LEVDMFLCSVLTLRKDINSNYQAVYKEVLGWWTAHGKSCSHTKQINAFAAKHIIHFTKQTIIGQNRNVPLPSDNW